MLKINKLTTLILCLSSTVAFAEVTNTSPVKQLQCDKPIATLVVSELSCKAAGCQNSTTTQNNPMAGLTAFAQMASGESSSTFPQVEKGLTAMLTSKLQQTGCFDIQDREALELLKSEMQMAGKTIEMTPAKYLITGSISSISLNTKKKDIAGGYIPSFIPVLGSMKKTSKSADISMDIKILDVQRAKVLSSQTFNGNDEKRSYDVSGGFSGMGGMTNIKGTPLESLIADILNQVSTFATQKIMGQEGVSQ